MIFVSKFAFKFNLYRCAVELQYFELASYQVGPGAMVIRHKDGIRLTISSGGVISELDMAPLFETFIQAFLLLNLANIICKCIAYNVQASNPACFCSSASTR
jgi:hypothetical protein